MKEPKITEGPWEVDHTDLGEFLIKGKHDYVCEVFENPQEVENAQAIEAVPEYLEALIPIAEEILSHVATEEYVNEDDLNPESHLGKITVTVQDARNIFKALKKAGVTEI